MEQKSGVPAARRRERQAATGGTSARSAASSPAPSTRSAASCSGDQSKTDASDAARAARAGRWAAAWSGADSAVWWRSASLGRSARASSAERSDLSDGSDSRSKTSPRHSGIATAHAERMSCAPAAVVGAPAEAHVGSVPVEVAAGRSDAEGSASASMSGSAKRGTRK